MNTTELSEKGFRRVASIFEAETGIVLGPQKMALVQTRLMSRARALNLPDLDHYFRHLEGSGPEERQALVDHLTTNETYFFRERAHFDALADFLARSAPAPLRLWSAACSSGEEAFTLAIVLAACRKGRGDEIYASDISQRVLAKASLGVYPNARLEGVPREVLREHFLRGVGRYADRVRVSAALRASVRFFRHNLLDDDPSLGAFDVVFLRNALIYFEPAKKQQILENIVARVRPGGLLFVGLSESLTGHALPVVAVGRSTYRKIGR